MIDDTVYEIEEEHLTAYIEIRSEVLINLYARGTKFLNNFVDFEKIILGLNPDIQSPIEDQEWFMHNSPFVEENMPTSTFFSRSMPLSDEQYQQIELQANMNPIFVYLSGNLASKIYVGFEDTQLYNVYPGEVMADLYFTPIAKEWYYTAKLQKDIVVNVPNAQDNYQVLRIAAPIVGNNEKLIGVVGANVQLTGIVSMFQNVQLVDGFVMLLSSIGIMINPPERWQISTNHAVAIYDTPLTGLDTDTWEEIQAADENGLIEFTAIDGLKYLCTSNVSNIESRVLFYSLVCIEYQSTQEMRQDVINSFDDTKAVIYQIVFITSALILVLLAILIYFTARANSQRFRAIRKIFTKIARRALFQNCTYNVSAEKARIKAGSLIGIVEAVERKLDKLTNLEDEYRDFVWNPTRPYDRYLWNEWAMKLPAKNKYKNKELVPMSAVKSIHEKQQVKLDQIFSLLCLMHRAVSYFIGQICLPKPTQLKSVSCYQKLWEGKQDQRPLSHLKLGLWVFPQRRSVMTSKRRHWTGRESKL